MSYDDSLLASSALFRIRFTLQDTDISNEFLTDNEIEYLLVKYSNNENLATLDAARRILGQFAQYTREREGQIEVYGNLIFSQWKEHLEELIGELTTAGGNVIIGGVSAAEINRVNDDTDSVGNGYEQDFLKNQVTHTSGTPLSNTGSFGRSSNNPFKIG
jgi:hypothetical protein